MSNYKPPSWYLTTQEFAEIVVDSLEKNNYFRRNEKAHPADIESAFSTTSSAIACAIDAVGKKIYEAEESQKKAIMSNKDLEKNIVVTSSDNIKLQESTFSSNDIDYLEHKYGKINK